MESSALIPSLLEEVLKRILTPELRAPRLLTPTETFSAAFSFILANTNLSDNYIRPVLLGITFFSISINSFLCLKKIKSKGLIYGLVIGVSYIFVLFVSSCVLNSGVNLTIYSYIQIIICILSGIIGGILGVNIK